MENRFEFGQGLPVEVRVRHRDLQGRDPHDVVVYLQVFDVRGNLVLQRVASLTCPAATDEGECWASYYFGPLLVGIRHSFAVLVIEEKGEEK